MNALLRPRAESGSPTGRAAGGAASSAGNACIGSPNDPEIVTADDPRSSSSTGKNTAGTPSGPNEKAFTARPVSGRKGGR